MTRINVVPPHTLTRQHLQGEYKEITRVVTLARNAYARRVRINAPTAYTLGKGHVLFFYKRIGYISKRYEALVAEMRARGGMSDEQREEIMRRLEDEDLQLD